MRRGRAAAAGPRKAAAGLVLGLILLAALSWTPAAQADADGVWVRVWRVNDGDTLTVRYRGRDERVRLLGVDAPETGHSQKLERAAARAGRSQGQEARLGDLARDYVAGLVGPGDRARLVFENGGERRDDHKRLLAWVWLADGRQLNQLLVAEGYARVYRRCRCQGLDRLLRLEDQARRQGRGLWALGGP